MLRNRLSLISILGWLGASLLALCGLPAAIDVIGKGTAEGYSQAFIGMWFAGEVLTLIYVILRHGFDKPLIFNYGLNLTFISIILYYMI